MLLDGYPKSYISYLTRLSRWIRGDYQILGYLSRKSNLNKLSKYKIIDNIRRSLVEITAISAILILVLLKSFFNVKTDWFIALMLISVAAPSILDLLQYIIFRKENIKKQKTFTNTIDGLKGSFYRAILNIITLPTKAYTSLDAIIRTIYRMTVSKEHLLEWTTSEEAEKKEKNSISGMFKVMLPNVVLGILFFALNIFVPCSIYFKTFTFTMSVLFLLAPIVMWDISMPKKEEKAVDKLTEEEKEYIRDVAKKTFEYFAKYLSKENSYLPPDNYQENRKESIVLRTSSTNIGLGILSVISGYDLKFITLEQVIVKLENILDTIKKLEKWNGHLYNWYNIKTLEPLRPKYVSTVDSRKFCGIYVHLKNVFRRKEKYSI